MLLGGKQRGEGVEVDGNEMRFCWTLRAAKGGKAGRARLGLACLGKPITGVGSHISHRWSGWRQEAGAFAGA